MKSIRLRDFGSWLCVVQIFTRFRELCYLFVAKQTPSRTFVLADIANNLLFVHWQLLHANYVEILVRQVRGRLCSPRDIQSSPRPWPVTPKLVRRAISITKDSSIVYHLGKLADTQKASNNRAPIAPFSYLHALSRPSIMVRLYVCAFEAGAHHYQTIRAPFRCIFITLQSLTRPIKVLSRIPGAESINKWVNEIPRRLCALSPALAFH